MSAAMSAGSANTANPDATMALLWERVRQRGDMPGFTRAVSAILGAMRGEDVQDFSMTQTVLSDPVLTQKVLRLANSGMYCAFGRRVNTVSKAVLVLGTDAIGHLALGLKLIEELAAASPGSGQARAEMEKSVLAGMVAQQVASRARPLKAEEAVVCSMLHTLGRLMVTFYLPERWSAMQHHAGAGQEDSAALLLLGLSMEDIGRAAARQWGLPDDLVDSMRHIDPCGAGVAGCDANWLAALSTMSAHSAQALWHGQDNGDTALASLATAFSVVLGVAQEDLMHAIAKASDAARADPALSYGRLGAEAAAGTAPPQRHEVGTILCEGLRDMRLAISGAGSETGGPGSVDGSAGAAHRAPGPGQMMSLALEILYRGLGCARAVAFQRNVRERKYVARLGFGAGAKENLPLMAFDDAYQPNVFHAALTSDRVIFIENARDPRFTAKLPPWWKRTLGDAHAFVVLPLGAGGQRAGFLYCDWDDRFPAGPLSQAEFELLNEVRALVMKSVEMARSGANMRGLASASSD